MMLKDDQWMTLKMVIMVHDHYDDDRQYHDDDLYYHGDNASIAVIIVSATGR